MSERHPRRYSIIGNHLTQHRELSLTAIGLGAHIQSLPDGAPVDIRTLAGRFPEGRGRIAGALRELEAHGYLERTRVRTPDGRIVTRTVAYHAPAARGGPGDAARPAVRATRPAVGAARPAVGDARPGPGGRTVGAAAPPRPPCPPAEPPPTARPAAPRYATPAPAPGPPPAAASAPPASSAPAPGGPVPPASAPGAHPPPASPPAALPPPAPATLPSPPPAAVRSPAPADPGPPAATRTLPAPGPIPAPRPAPPPLPGPAAPAPDGHRAAEALLAGLHRHEPRLLLSERDVRHLAPAVAAWLERGAGHDAVRHALTANLPADLRHPAALLAHRLTGLLPPQLPDDPPAPAAARPDPLQNCDSCDRAFRSPSPGHCRECRTAAGGTAR
ncbi:hypothetical protein [Streptomyces sp. NPDC018031]|uniref:hypothetical protein n=1 Tax=Streptomyces sp. NPDC018031 TaxID=3365033 RepID=UPI0037B015E5